MYDDAGAVNNISGTGFVELALLFIINVRGFVALQSHDGGGLPQQNLVQSYVSSQGLVAHRKNGSVHGGLRDRYLRETLVVCCFQFG